MRLFLSEYLCLISRIISFIEILYLKILILANIEIMPRQSNLIFLLIFTAFFSFVKSACLTGVQGCALCLSSTQCKTCMTGTFLNSTYQCQSCPTGCTSCNSTIYCFGCFDTFVNSSNLCRCRYAYGVDYIANKCVRCLEVNCNSCYDDYTICALCAAPYGLTSNRTCSPCLVSNCFYCNNNYQFCSGCKAQYGIVNNLLCSPCWITYCI